MYTTLVLMILLIIAAALLARTGTVVPQQSAYVFEKLWLPDGGIRQCRAATLGDLYAR